MNSLCTVHTLIYLLNCDQNFFLRLWKNKYFFLLLQKYLMSTISPKQDHFIYGGFLCLYPIQDGERNPIPGYFAEAPSSASIRNNWLYFAVRSPLQGAPVLICPVQRPTAKSAM